MSRFVGEYFNEIASDFDSYYERPNSLPAVIINEWLRKPGLLRRLQSALALTNPRPGLKILDIGCGSGKYVVECAKAGADVTGIDISPEMIKLAKKFCEENQVNVSLHVGDATRRMQNSYDICVALGVIEYFEDPIIVLRNMIEAANSRVIFSVPKQFAFQVPLRELMLHYRGINCYYYTKKKILSITKNFEAKSILIYDCGPVYTVGIDLE
jgi:2-polyprenyl-3-methyl-5-hydroxy-6-metoxy-1,4-benzoquinol methylase